MLAATPVGCAKCLPCRIKQRKIWAHRMCLESAKHASSAFVTLTYDQMTLPYGSTLVPRDLTMWLKRLRREFIDKKIRYFVAGEYGEETCRPHYHVALFGISALEAGGDDGCGGPVKKTWGLGFSYVGELTPASASYICGYVTKKMIYKDDKRLIGRHPEFRRMSLKPGLGASAMKDVAGILEPWVKNEMFENAEFPSVLRHGKRLLTLGKYLRVKLRTELGYGQLTTEEEKKLYAQKMQLLWALEKKTAEDEKRPLKNPCIEEQKIKNLEARFKIMNKKGEI